MGGDGCFSDIAGFNTQPPEGGCSQAGHMDYGIGRFNTQPPEGGCPSERRKPRSPCVSTHSRPKAAACVLLSRLPTTKGFNTQPPEGGCGQKVFASIEIIEFQHTAARRRLPPAWQRCSVAWFQHTAARRRLPARRAEMHALRVVSTHSRPKAAAAGGDVGGGGLRVSTHSRPKAAAHSAPAARRRLHVSTHSRPKAAAPRRRLPGSRWRFQHTAARRRLPPESSSQRPDTCFNTQPPEGGCQAGGQAAHCYQAFQHTAARRRLQCVCL